MGNCVGKCPNKKRKKTLGGIAVTTKGDFTM
jgi:hypothetical protein